MTAIIGALKTLKKKKTVYHGEAHKKSRQIFFLFSKNKTKNKPQNEWTDS